MIADGFTPAKGNNKMSPGAPKTFYPSDAYANEMVLLLILFHLIWSVVIGAVLTSWK